MAAARNRWFWAVNRRLSFEVTPKATSYFLSLDRQVCFALSDLSKNTFPSRVTVLDTEATYIHHQIYYPHASIYDLSILRQRILMVEFYGGLKVINKDGTSHFVAVTGLKCEHYYSIHTTQLGKCLNK